MPKGKSDLIRGSGQGERAQKPGARKQKGSAPADTDRLIHELEVHQAELEMQNEELRRGRKELEESREKYVDLYDFAPVGYLTFNDRGLVTDVNFTAARLLGIEKKLLINGPLSSFVPREYQGLFHLHLGEVLKSAAKQVCELVMKKRDGTRFDARIESILKGKNGDKTIRSVLTDISERKQTEKAIRDEERFGLLFQHHHAIMLLIDPDSGAIVDANEAAAHFYGYPLSILRTMNIADINALPARDGLTAARKRAGKEELNYFIFPHRLAGGEVRTVEVHSSPIEIHGQVMLFCIVHDITEREEMEEALRESEERYRTAIENASDGIALISGDRHLYVNRRFAEMFGYDDPAEMVGKPLSFTVHPDDVAMVSKFNRLRQGGESAPSRYEFRGVRKDGKTRFMEVSAARTHFRGRPVSLAYIRDITEYKNLEERLRQSQKMEAIGTLAGGIAHDFNNILAGIIGFTEMALDDLPPGSPSRRRLELVLKSGFRGRDLVRQILAFSRKTKGRREPTSLSSILKETLKLLRASLPATIQITADMGSGHDMVLASTSELQQIIMNLSTNAAQAMREAGGQLIITLTVENIGVTSPAASGLPPGQYVELAIKDTGMGMDPEVITRIFEPFFTTKGPGKGTGMGLAVVYGIVKGLNGDITVESTPGIGSTFRIFLPMVDGDAASRGLVKEARGGTERILFVDDEEVLTELGKGMLEKLGYTVTAVTDSVEALKAFSEDPSRFDLVFTDQTMPEITGIDLAAELFKVRPDIPVILATGYSDAVSQEQATASGIKGYLMKPLSRREIAAEIRRILDEKPEV